MASVSLSCAVSASKSNGGAARGIFAAGGTTLLTAWGAGVLALGADAAAGAGCGRAGVLTLGADAAAGAGCGEAGARCGAAGCATAGCGVTFGGAETGVSVLTWAQPAVSSTSRTAA